MKLLKNKTRVIWISILLIMIFFFWQNNHIVINKIEYKNKEVPKGFSGFKIIHISDLHNKRFGRGQKNLMKKINKSLPDMIIVTGDLIDRRKYNLEIAMEFIEAAIEIAPVYYVAGNHEAWSGEYEIIKKELLRAGVLVLDNQKTELIRNDSKIEIIGLKDPAFYHESFFEELELLKLENELKSLASKDIFQILLSHRPDLFDLYAREEIDLSFSGHAHGGQFRLPFLGGLVAPDQGLLPKYTSGLYKLGDSSLIVSRGLGNSIIPIRIFNRPELVEVTLKPDR